ncbi:hypothetical protein KIPB_003311 [Kipferlia bialata]|uniref:DUF4470 domain-containing protein n=1 Tax=Kipferlia bialata TaxID=797122 RepID=A0A9K3GH43_9EUKA|nr:hypothetical protein KIPB_003311 [Kipferlia bialata]|eukprot:g3311.t1
MSVPWYNTLNLENCLIGNRRSCTTPFNYSFGNSVAASLLNGIPHKERTGQCGAEPISILSLGCGDPRNLLQTLVSISLGLPECPPLRVSLNDISISQLARDVLLVYMMARTPPVGDPGRHVHISTVVDAWYAMETTPERRRVMMDAVKELVLSLSSIEAASNLDWLNDGRKGILTFPNDVDREAVLAELLFWQGLPRKTSKRVKKEAVEGWKATLDHSYSGRDMMMTVGHGFQATFVLSLSNDVLGSQVWDCVLGDLEAFRAHGVIRTVEPSAIKAVATTGKGQTKPKRGRERQRRGKHMGGQSAKATTPSHAITTCTTLCPPAYASAFWPLTRRDFSSVPYEGVVPLAVGAPERTAIINSPTPHTALMEHSVSVWADALCGRGPHNAVHHLLSVEMYHGDLGVVCEEMRQDNRTFAFIQSSNVPDEVGLLPYLMFTVPLLRHGDPARDIQPGIVMLKSFNIHSETEDNILRWTGIPIHMMPSVLGCVPLTLIPTGQNGTQRPLENYATNSASGFRNPVGGRSVVAELFRRVPPPPLSHPGVVPLSVAVGSENFSWVFNSLIKRAVPSGLNNLCNTEAMSSPATIVRLLLFALSDGRIHPDVDVTSPDGGLCLGLSELETMTVFNYRDWVSNRVSKI